MGKLARRNAERRMSGGMPYGRMRDTGEPVTIEHMLKMLDEKVHYEQEALVVTATVPFIEGVEGVATAKEASVAGYSLALLEAKQLLLNGVKIKLQLEEQARLMGGH